jgi:outer membrane protein OmpA-like peptidoglycan-associated protein
VAARKLRTRSSALIAAAAGLATAAAVHALEPVVYFGFDSAVLAPSGAVSLRQVVDHFRGEGYSRLVVVGHADAAGPAGYNEVLSERRARAVADQLRRFGVDPVVVRAEGVGESEPAVPTPDGVPEARNRRAEIVFLK